MKPSSLSFRKRLLLFFLAAGILPLAACVTIMLTIFGTAVSNSEQTEAQARLAGMTASLEETAEDCDEVLRRLCASRPLTASLSDPDSHDSDVYRMLYAAAASMLRQAEFSVYDATGRIRYTTGEVGSQEALDAGWGLLRAAGASDGPAWGGASLPERGENCLRLCRAIREKDEISGYAVAKLTEEHLARLLEDPADAGSGVLVLDAFWEPLYASPSLADTGVAGALRASLLTGSTPPEGQNYLFEVRREETTGLVLALCRLQPLTRQMMQSLYLVAGGAILLSALLCLLFSMLFARRTFAPIRSLNAAMTRVENGDLDTRMEVSGTDELSQLEGRFNRMTGQLKTYLEDSIRQQKDLGDARIRMMQAQLNPHFLYNTLDTLKWLGKINRVEEVSTISADLADILRLSISADSFVCLGDELALLDRYVEIQKIRFPDKFTYTADVPEELLDALVPKLMLQPLVENAVIHGFEDGRPGRVEVSARAGDGEMTVTVMDDGVGMSQESRERFLRRDAPQKGRPGHLGLYNVDAILRLHYGEGSGLRLIPSEKGTVLQAALPLRFREQEGEEEENSDA